MMGHLGQLVLGFIAPLVVMLVKGEESPYIKHQAKEGLNFVITMYIALVVGYAGFILGSFLLVGGLLFFPVIMVLIALLYVMPIIAALAVNKNGWYRYPFILRLIK